VLAEFSKNMIKGGQKYVSNALDNVIDSSVNSQNFPVRMKNGGAKMQANRYVDWHFIYGKPVDFWMVQARAVGQFIKANKIKPVAQEALRASSAGEAPAKAVEIAAEPWWWKYGGMRVPHLHYGGELYLLDQEQWKAFSGGIVKEFSKKLAAANSVNFGQLMEISEAVNEIV
jgi:hypothetical protein